MIRRIDNGSAARADMESGASARVIRLHRTNCKRPYGCRFEVKLVDTTESLHPIQANWKVDCVHLVTQTLFDAAAVARSGENMKPVPSLIQRSEKRKSLNVVPVHVGNKQVRGYRRRAELAEKIAA